MGPRVAGRRWRVALAAGLLVTFVGCSGGPTVDPTIKVEEGKKAEESTKASPNLRAGVKKQDPAPTQRTTRGPG